MLKRLGLIFLMLFIIVMLAGCGDTTTNATDTTNETQKQPASIQPVDDSDSGIKLSEDILNDTTKAHFIDVGQADATLIQLPNEQNILIDAGNNSDGNLVVNYLKQQQVIKLDHVIGTHPHEDHVGGLDTVIQNFEVGKVYLPRVSHTTKTYNDVLTLSKTRV